MENYCAAIYCRLSKDDDQKGESVSIGTQKSMLTDYCDEHGFLVYDIYIDDGYSGTTFDRPAFQRLLTDVDNELVNMVITKDLSRLGRDYIMTGYYSEIYFPDHGVRYIALADNYDSDKLENDIAPFKNILNDMYARDISRKIKTAKRQRAKDGLFIASYTPYGYRKKSDNRNQLEIDEEAAEVVRLIYDLALGGMGTVNIAKELESRRITNPGSYKHEHGDIKFAEYYEDEPERRFAWTPTTIRTILKDEVYLGNLINLKTEVTNYKTKMRISVPPDEWIVCKDAHEAIISREEYDKVQAIISQHQCPAKFHRNNIFRGLLFCSECGHPLSIAHRKLTYHEDDSYRCMHHFYHPEACTQTHVIYHKDLHDYVLSEILALAKAMKRRNVHLGIVEYANIDKLSPEILNAVIRRIEIGHVTRKSKMKNVVKIYWKLE